MVRRLAETALTLVVLTVAIMGQSSSLTKRQFGRLAFGEAVEIYTLANRHGASASVMTYGSTLVSLRVPDRNGHLADVVLGYDDLAAYVAGTYYYGAFVGRYANRIAAGRFTLDGKTYTLAVNNGPNSLHGGKRGFDKRIWQATEITSPRGPALRLHYLSRDGEEGYPGNLDVTVTWSFDDDNALRLDYRATTDRDTVLNLTLHPYFNLAGRGSGDILAEQLTVHAARFTPVDVNLIPIGELRAVAGTPFDFRQPVALGARIHTPDQQLKFGNGYDQNFVLDADALGAEKTAADLYDPASGRRLLLSTTQPGLQVYTGNYLIPPHGGVALEAQHFPDSPNHPTFPSTELKPGQVFTATTIYRFTTQAAAH